MAILIININRNHFLQYRFLGGGGEGESLYLEPEFYVCVSVSSEPTGNSLSHSEKVFNIFIGIIKQVWTFTFHRWAAIVGEFYRRHCLQFTV